VSEILNSGPGPLPPTPRPQGAYQAAVVEGGLAFSAGMTPRRDGRLTLRGLVGGEIEPEQARQGAHLAARNALAAILAELADPGRLRRCLRMTVFIACAEGFEDLSTVADGASLALLEYLGPDSLPVRSAIGVRALPSGAPVEVELTVSVAPDPSR